MNYVKVKRSKSLQIETFRKIIKSSIIIKLKNCEARYIECTILISQTNNRLVLSSDGITKYSQG